MSTLGKWRRKVKKFWKKNKIKDDIHDWAEKLLDEYELAIAVLVSDVVVRLNAQIERTLRNQGVAEGIIDAVQITQKEAEKISKQIVEELSRLIDKLL